ncbi:MAG: hypothetical protein MJZ90_11500 [Bacteroidales bacterium]|nr:hypothetical protein [Bacteroidales bacterium]
MRNIIAVFLTSLALLSSCKGDRGPAGPAGQDGNANVQSATIETKFSDWDWSDEAMNWAIAFDWDAIDMDMVDYGAMLVYLENPSSEVYAWHQLPLTMAITDEYSAILETSYYDYGFSIFWTNSDLQKHRDVLQSYYDQEPMMFKVVLIDATSYASHPDIDYSDYEKVANAFGLGK